MLLSEEEVQKRLTSPLNLMNRMAPAAPQNNTTSRNTAMSLFGLGGSRINVPYVKPEVKEETKEVNEPTIPQHSTNLIPFNNPFIETNSFIRNEIALGATREEPKSEEPQAPRLEDLIDDSDTKVKMATLHSVALDTLNAAMNRLHCHIDAIHPEKLPAIITATGKVVESIRKERIELDKGGKEKNIHYHFYTPEQKSISDYEIIDVAPTKEAQVTR